jgi:hypothetical protein
VVGCEWHAAEVAVFESVAVAFEGEPGATPRGSRHDVDVVYQSVDHRDNSIPVRSETPGCGAIASFWPDHGCESFSSVARVASEANPGSTSTPVISAGATTGVGVIAQGTSRFVMLTSIPPIRRPAAPQLPRRSAAQ